jgi:GT2 family glycosyltransferase
MARVTVVVPTYERGAAVARSLAALAGVRAPEGGFEVIVVDDGSSAEHATAVEHAARRVENARVVRQENRGPAAARNVGYRAGSGELVAFLDDDCAPARDWLVRLIEPLERDRAVAAVGGRVLPAPATNWVSRFLAATEYSSGVQPVFENAATANACYRRSVLDELRGFDERFTTPGGDDPDLSARARAAGHRLEFVPEAIVYHAEFDRLGPFLRSMYNRGVGEARLAGKQGRRRRTLLRVVLFPAYLARTGAGAWRRTQGKGGAAVRMAWVALELAGRLAFLSGSARGLASDR